MASNQYDTIIFDIGDVLFDWDASAITALPPKMIRLMMHTETWHELDRNTVPTDKAYQVFAPFRHRSVFPPCSTPRVLR